MDNRNVLNDKSLEKVNGGFTPKPEPVMAKRQGQAGNSDKHDPHCLYCGKTFEECLVCPYYRK